MAPKRPRHVSFASKPTEPSGSQSMSAAHSLLADEDASANITPFNLDEELRSGNTYSEADGFVPAALTAIASDAASQSSRSSDASSPERETPGQALKVRSGGVEVDDDGQWSDSSGESAGASRDAKRPRGEGKSAFVDAVVSLLVLLHADETPAALIRRVARGAKGASEENVGSRGTETVSSVTDLCQTLVGNGAVGLYTMRRHEIRALCLQWELRWGTEAETHGPFDGAQMVAWASAGYFSQAGRRGFVRGVGGSWVEAERVFPRRVNLERARGTCVLQHESGQK